VAFSPYHYTTTQRHGYGAPGAGDFDTPGYLGSAQGDYGFAPLLAIPAWAWLTGAAATATGGAYLYGKSSGAGAAAEAAALTQASAQPAPGSYAPVPQGQLPAGYAPGYAPPAPTASVTDQPWFWPAVLLGGAAVLLYTLRGRA
jgi:hypothetical protein